MRRPVSPRWLLVVLFPLLPAGCFETGTDGAIVSSVDVLRADGGVSFTGYECNAIVLDGYEFISEPSYEFFSLYTHSSKGKIREKLFIRPEGAPSDYEVTTQSGEVAMEWTFDPSSFGEEDFQIDEIMNHEGDTIWVSHWGAEDSCENSDAPEGYENPLW
jgi:hypothetical protein